MEDVKKLLEELYAGGGTEGDDPDELERAAAKITALAVRLRVRAYQLRTSSRGRRTA